jgi:tetratricopeptide (TPR) repeat protein
MSEMLGNRYFLIRDYPRAAGALEKALVKDPANKAIERKLIVCYTQTGEIKKALEIFLSLAYKDLEFIVNTSLFDDDCPCAGLVFEMENMLFNNVNSLEFHLKLAMLWLYCDIEKSLYYFALAQRLAPDNRIIKQIITLLKNHSQKEEAYS